MKVKKMIEWLKTQDQDAEVCVVKLDEESGIKFYCWDKFHPQYDCQIDEDKKVIFLGDVSPGFFKKD